MASLEAQDGCGKHPGKGTFNPEKGTFNPEKGTIGGGNPMILKAFSALKTRKNRKKRR
jgi:hypothetical protein